MKVRSLLYPLLIMGALLILVISCKKNDPIIKKDVTITWSNPADITVGTLLSTTQLNATADVPGTFVYTPAIGASLPVGASQELKVDFTPTDAANFNAATKAVTINVNAKKDPIISWENPADVTMGTILSANQLNATADVPGTFVYTPAIGASLAVGANQELKVDFTPDNVVDYNVASKTVKINVIANTFTDPRDGTVYRLVTIGAQVWMAENLRYLPSVANLNTGSATEPYYYVYGYWGSNLTDAKAEANYSTYGVLYNWPAAKNVCPNGWHLPSDAEWTQLINYLGGGYIAGSKLKETGITHWRNPNDGATNETGFTALPGGFRDSFGAIGSINVVGGWLSATEVNADHARTLIMSCNYSDVVWADRNKGEGWSIRCLRD